MKKMIISVAVIMVICFLFYGFALAINVGDLEENLRISGPSACVRPILIYSLENKLDVYITGEIIKSATVLQSKSNNSSLSYIEREKVIEKFYWIRHCFRGVEV